MSIIIFQVQRCLPRLICIWAVIGWSLFWDITIFPSVLWWEIQKWWESCWVKWKKMLVLSMCTAPLWAFSLSKVRNLDPSIHCLRLRRCVNDWMEVWTPAPHEILQDLVPELGTSLFSRLDSLLSVMQIGVTLAMRTLIIFAVALEVWGFQLLCPVCFSCLPLQLERWKSIWKWCCNQNVQTKALSRSSCIPPTSCSV